MPTLSERSLRLLEPLRYGDLFEFPLTAAEVRRYCTAAIGTEETLAALRTDPELTARVEEKEELFFLNGRSHLVYQRQRRARLSRELWQRSQRLLERIARLPFVRGVAVTGSLAVENVDGAGDLDLMLLTAPDRLWTVHLPVRLLERTTRGFRLCANYYLTTRQLELPERSIFVAREILQMRPLAGRAAWDNFYACNRWVADFFPNWEGPQLAEVPELRSPRPRWERILSGALGDSLERRVRQLVLFRLARNPKLRGADWSERGVIVEPDRFMLHMALYHRLLPCIYEHPIRD
jgi:hypothetical protein